DDTGRIRAEWRELGVYEALEHLYDGIAVYGSPALYDVAEAYGIPPCVRPKLHYCGYVVRDVPAVSVDADHVRRQYGVPGSGPLVVATVGSGRDRKSTRLNSSHRTTSYAVFCLKKKKIASGTLLLPAHFLPART